METSTKRFLVIGICEVIQKQVRKQHNFLVNFFVVKVFVIYKRTIWILQSSIEGLTNVGEIIDFVNKYGWRLLAKYAKNDDVVEDHKIYSQLWIYPTNRMCIYVSILLYVIKICNQFCCI